jgi:hypothetical protein
VRFDVPNDFLFTYTSQAKDKCLASSITADKAVPLLSHPRDVTVSSVASYSILRPRTTSPSFPDSLPDVNVVTPRHTSIPASFFDFLPASTSSTTPPEGYSPDMIYTDGMKDGTVDDQILRTMSEIVFKDVLGVEVDDVLVDKAISILRGPLCEMSVSMERYGSAESNVTISDCLGALTYQSFSVVVGKVDKQLGHDCTSLSTAFSCQGIPHYPAERVITSSSKEKHSLAHRHTLSKCVYTFVMHLVHTQETKFVNALKKSGIYGHTFSAY